MPLRRIGLIGDIHAEDELLERALDFLAGRSVELVAATGDVTDGAGSVERCCALLRERRVIAVRGNHERWFIAGTARELPEATPLGSLSADAQTFLAKLPLLVELDVMGGRALLCHGLGPNDMARVLPDDEGYWIAENEDLQRLVKSKLYRYVLNGHSHRRMVRNFAGMTLVNAGTLKRDHNPCFLELDFGAGVVSVFVLTLDEREPHLVETLSLSP